MEYRQHKHASICDTKLQFAVQRCVAPRTVEGDLVLLVGREGGHSMKLQTFGATLICSSRTVPLQSAIGIAKRAASRAQRWPLLCARGDFMISFTQESEQLLF